MDKSSFVPSQFPVGRLRLTGMLSARRSGSTRALPPLLARAGGTPPRWKPGQTLQGEHRQIGARMEGGTLSQWAASKAPDVQPAARAPQESHAVAEMQVRPEVQVEKAAAEPSFAHAIRRGARALLRGPKVPKPNRALVPPGAKVAADPLTAAGLGAIGAASGFFTSFALQQGINQARAMMWRNLTAREKAAIILGRLKQALGVPR